MLKYGKSGCQKCGATYIPPYSTVAAAADGDELRAIVKMRAGVYIETVAGKRRLTPAESIELPYAMLINILQQEGAIFYFRHGADRATFKLVYPKFANEDL